MFFKIYLESVSVTETKLLLLREGLKKNMFFIHILWIRGAQCTLKVSLLVGLKEVKSQVVSFYVTAIHKDQQS